jgi:hypothetical protein
MEFQAWAFSRLAMENCKAKQWCMSINASHAASHTLQWEVSWKSMFFGRPSYTVNVEILFLFVSHVQCQRAMFDKHKLRIS